MNLNDIKDEETRDRIRRENFKKAGVLLEAVRENDIEKVKTLLCYNDKSEEKVKFRKWYVNERSWNDWIALHAATEQGLVPMTELLLECGSEINAISDVLYTPLHLAASGGHADIVTILLQNKADTRILTEAGLNGTALHYAAGKGHYEICRLLTNTPGSEDLVNDLSWDECTALYYTVLGGHVDIVKLLLQRGGKKTIHSTDNDGLSPLHNSVLANSVEIAKILVEEGGADVKLEDKRERTPADLANQLGLGKSELMKYLKQKMMEKF